MTTINAGVDDLTLEEVILFEETTGYGFDQAMEAMSAPGPKFRLIAGLNYVLARRDNPDLEFDEFTKATKLADVAGDGSAGKAKKKPAAKRGSKRAATTGSKTGRSSSTSSGGSRRRTSGA